MERSTELFAAICLLVVGFSHIAQPQAWVDFFTRLRDKGPAGVLIVAFLSLPFGAFIVAFHNVWSGLPIILTLFGWAQVIKGSLYLIAPQLGMRSLSRVTPERSWMFVVGGAFSLCISAVLWYLVFFQR